MKNNNIPLAIILKRTQNGYTFESLQEVHSNKDKNKKPKPGRKPAPKGVPNRLIKQIGLSNEQLVSQITPIPEPQPTHHFEDEPQQNLPVFQQQVHEEEQVSCEIDRETQLPKTPAMWFDKLNIHQIEKKQLKEFFSGSQSKTPNLYMKYRNFMVDSYQKNSKRYLSKIACRRILRGDANSIMRIHEFLQRQGIINFAISYDGNYSFKTNSLSKPHQQRNKPQTVLKSLPDQDQQTASKQVDTDNMTITVINKNFSRTYRACCTECKLICGIVWFANVHQEESASQKNLCYECWTKKSQTQKNDYVKVDIVKKMEAHGRDGKNFPKNAWNIEQNVKLLDFMSNGQKSWKKLLDEFGGKRSIEDIVLQFLQFPISNVELNESKKQLQKKINQNQTSPIDIGFNPSDYKNILSKFYEDSEYYKKAKKRGQNGQSKLSVVGTKQQYQPETEHSQEIGEMLALTMQKIVAKVEGLKQHEKFVQSKINSYDSLVSYKMSRVRLNEEQEVLPKSSTQLENKSKSLKNCPDKKNESSQIIDGLEIDDAEL